MGGGKATRAATSTLLYVDPLLLIEQSRLNARTRIQFERQLNKLRRAARRPGMWKLKESNAALPWHALRWDVWHNTSYETFQIEPQAALRAMMSDLGLAYVPPDEQSTHRRRGGAINPDGRPCVQSGRIPADECVALHYGIKTVKSSSEDLERLLINYAALVKRLNGSVGSACLRAQLQSREPQRAGHWASVCSDVRTRLPQPLTRLPELPGDTIVLECETSQCRRAGIPAPPQKLRAPFNECFEDVALGSRLCEVASQKLRVYRATGTGTADRTARVQVCVRTRRNGGGGFAAPAADWLRQLDLSHLA